MMKTMTLQLQTYAKLTTVIFAVVIAVSAATCPAWADEHTESKAESLASQATTAFKAGRFTQAAMLFKQAYAQVPRPSLLFNSARAYQKGGHLRESLPLFRLYLTLNTGSDEHSKQGRAEAVEHISEIEKLLVKQERRSNAAQSTDASPDSSPSPAAKPNPPQKIDPPSPSAPKTVSPQVPSPPRSAPSAISTDTKAQSTAKSQQVVSTHLAGRSEGWSERKILAVTLLSAGGALVAGGIALRIAGASVDDEINGALSETIQADGVTFYPGAKQQQIDNLASRQSGFKTGGNLVLALGLASAAVGGYFWWNRQHGNGALSLSPSYNGEALSWTLSGRF